jgi:DNA repair exonuclease SbcCD ATPase subunit
LERVQRISKEKTGNLPEKLLQEIDEEQIQARIDIKTLKKTKEKITKDSFVLSEKLEQISELDVEISSLEKRLKTEEETNTIEINKEMKKLDRIDFTSEKDRKLKELQKKSQSHKEVQDGFKNIKIELETKIDPSGKIQLIQKELEEIENEIRGFMIELQDHAAFSDEYEQFIINLNLEKREKDELNNTIIRLDQKLTELDLKMKELVKLKPEIDLMKQSINSLKKKQDILQKLRTEIFHTKGAPFYAINKILPRLGKRASLILTELTNQRFSHIQLNKIEKGSQGMGFEILIKATDGVRDVSTFSGGERTQINAALRLAISEEISNLSQRDDSTKVGKKTLFIDEGDLGSLDTLEAQAAFVKKLFNLSRNFKIILITHLQEIANQFPNSINISRDSYGRSIQVEANKTE